MGTNIGAEAGPALVRRTEDVKSNAGVTTVHRTPRDLPMPQRSLAILALVAAGTAQAKDIVIYAEGSPEEAVAMVTRASGVSPHLLSPVHLSDLVRDEFV